MSDVSSNREYSAPEGYYRVALIVEYDGQNTVGLQRQREGRSIQGDIEGAAAKLGAADCRFRASGRTDAGVHARGQVIAIDLPEKIALKSVVPAMNWHLPENIRVRRTAIPAADFDPRRDAIRRTYRYLLCAGQPFPPLMVGRMGQCKTRLNLELMREGARVLEGHHDFRAWRSTMCQAKRTELTLEQLEPKAWEGGAMHGLDDQCFEFTVVCRSFLHRMVRYLVGGLIEVGRGRLTIEELRRHLDEKALPPRVAPADACGLSLELVDYPPERDPFIR